MQHDPMVSRQPHDIIPRLFADAALVEAHRCGVSSHRLLRDSRDAPDLRAATFVSGRDDLPLVMLDVH